MKVNKAFKGILMAQVPKFAGVRRLDYKPWKEALRRELKGLSLDANQTLDLLQIRTSGKALACLQPALILRQEASA